MMEIEFQPDLSHCIQTLAKAEYDRIMRELLISDVHDSELKEQLELLKMFLESTDFGKLRGAYEPFLVEGNRVSFILRPKGSKFECQMEVR